MGCAGDDGAPDLDALRQPTGLALTPDGRRLFVSGGNWDLREAGGTVVAVDLEALHAALGGLVAAPGEAIDGSRPCRFADRAHTVRECDPAAFIDAAQSRVLGSALGNIAIDEPRGAEGPVRLLVTQRSPPAIAWLDVERVDFSVECGQGEGVRCDLDHATTQGGLDGGISLPADPSRVTVDAQGFRFAYVPHLRGGALSLLALDGEQGPELATVMTDFFREDAFGLDLAGGFAVAGRPCDPLDPPPESRDCTRPVLYATQRYWPGMRTFTVAPGLEVILGGTTSAVAPVGVGAVESRPIMGSLVFEGERTASSLLVVQTTPGALARVDTQVEEGTLSTDVVGRVSLCSNPNQIALGRVSGQDPLALVTCYGDGRLAVVSLSTFSLVASIPLGAGANEVVVDADRRQAYVANTLEHTVSIIHLDATDPRYLREWARIGVAVRDG